MAIVDEESRRTSRAAQQLGQLPGQRANAFGDAAAVNTNLGVTQPASVVRKPVPAWTSGAAVPAPAPMQTINQMANPASVAQTLSMVSSVQDGARHAPPPAPAPISNPAQAVTPRARDVAQQQMDQQRAGREADRAARQAERAAWNADYEANGAQSALEGRAALNQHLTNRGVRPARTPQEYQAQQTEARAKADAYVGAAPASPGGAVAALASGGPQYGDIKPRGAADLAIGNRPTPASFGGAPVPQNPWAASAPAPMPVGGDTAVAQGAAPATSINGYNAVDQLSGVYRKGNSYTDTPGGGVSTNGLSPAVSVGNLNAIGNGEGGQAVRALAEVPQFQAPEVANASNDWAARNELRNLAVSANSITNNGGRFDARRDGRGRMPNGAGASPAQVAYEQALKADATARGQQSGLQADAMRANSRLGETALQQMGNLERETLLQSGASRRAEMDARLEQQKINQAGEAAGFANRAAGQLEQLRGVLTSQEATPEQRRSAIETMSALSGRTAESPWKVQVTPTTRNADNSTSEGSIVRWNAQTGQVERVGAQGQGGATTVESPQQLAALPSGALYVGPDGKQYRKN